MASTQRTKRPWLQLSLCSLLVLFTLVCIWLGFKVTAASRQKQAVQAILKIPGKNSLPSINYDFQFDSKGQRIPNRNPPWPEWLRSALGEDLFTNAIGVNLDGTAADDDDLVHVKGIPKLRRLDLESTLVTDRGIQSMAECHHLERLICKKLG